MVSDKRLFSGRLFCRWLALCLMNIIQGVVSELVVVVSVCPVVFLLGVHTHCCGLNGFLQALPIGPHPLQTSAGSLHQRLDEKSSLLSNLLFRPCHLPHTPALASVSHCGLSLTI